MLFMSLFVFGHYSYANAYLYKLKPEFASLAQLVANES